MRRESLRYRAVAGAMLVLFLVGPLSLARSGHSLPSRQSALPDLSNDALWDDGFGFGSDNDFNARVFAIAVVDNDVYVGGRFTTAGGLPARSIAKWDGKTWSPLGGGPDNCRGAFCLRTVYALAGKDKDLYAGGNFLSISGVLANQVARWDGVDWSSLGDGVQICNLSNDCVTPLSLAATQGGIYAAGRIITDVGSFDTISVLRGLTRWDGNFWAVQDQVTGINAIVAIYAIEVGPKGIYVGGAFNAAGSTAANNIAFFDGSKWSGLGGGVQGCAGTSPAFPCSAYVYTTAALDADIYVGGAFSSAGGIPANNIAKWDGDKWTPLGVGANGPVRKIAINRNIIYVGGEFTSIGGVEANGIARFEGDKWSALGSGVAGYVDAIAFKDNEVYLGGVFGKAGGKTAHNFARWIDPTFVPPPPPETLPQINRISVTGKKLFITGERFDEGSVLLLNGEPEKTMNDEQNPTTQLIAKKTGKKIRNGDKLRVQDSKGNLSPEFSVIL
jgi:hypothetical protein